MDRQVPDSIGRETDAAYAGWLGDWLTQTRPRLGPCYVPGCLEDGVNECPGKHDDGHRLMCQGHTIYYAEQTVCQDHEPS